MGSFHLIDTPGLAEDDEALDRYYLNLIKQKIMLKYINGFIDVTKLNETRFRPDEKRTLRLLTEELGISIWRNAWLVFTFAASVPKDKFEELFTKRIQDIEQYIRQLVSKQKSSFYFQGFELTLCGDNNSHDWSFNCIYMASKFKK